MVSKEKDVVSVPMSGIDWRRINASGVEPGRPRTSANERSQSAACWRTRNGTGTIQRVTPPDERPKFEPWGYSREYARPDAAFVESRGSSPSNRPDPRYRALQEELNALDDSAESRQRKGALVTDYFSTRRNEKEERAANAESTLEDSIEDLEDLQVASARSLAGLSDTLRDLASRVDTIENELGAKVSRLNSYFWFAIVVLTFVAVAYFTRAG
jgi:hypothetical protein